MTMRGQRYNIDLEDPVVLPNEHNKPSLLRNIQERNGTGIEPVAPTPNSSDTGFPGHTKKRLSRFKRMGLETEHERVFVQKNTNADEVPFAAREKDAINEENKTRLASMSEAEIFQEQEDLRSALSPTLIASLMKRPDGQKDEHSSLTTLRSGASVLPGASKEAPDDSATKGLDELATIAPKSNSLLSRSDEAVTSLKEAQAPAEHILKRPADNIHFPKPPLPPDLDLNDPDFNRKLHSAYFPALPTDPSGLSWMQAISDEERAEYSPAAEAFAASSIRFDFKGHLIPPRLAAQIPVTKGLHHHGDAPESAGYTIPELGLLAQSVIAGQRCIAYQTLGRILYRLGKGVYGHEGDDLYEGLWQAVERSKVLDEMIQVAARENEGHRSVWAYATDAVHLWRKGGGKRWQGR